METRPGKHGQGLLDKRLEVPGQINWEREVSVEKYKDCTVELVDCSADDLVKISKHIWVGGHER